MIKKLLPSLFLCFILTFSLFALPKSIDNKLDSHTTSSGIIYTVWQENDGDLYITVESEYEKDKLKVDADTYDHAKFIINELDSSLSGYTKNPLKSYIKDYKRWGEWEKDDDTRIKYFELEDELFENYYNKSENTYDFFDEL